MQNNLFILFIAITFNLFILFPSIQAQTQISFGAISGTVTDADIGETLPFVNVAIEVNGKLIGATTNFDGIYVIDSIPEGVYEIYFSYVGYQTKKIEGVPISKEGTLLLDAKLNGAPEVIDLYVPIFPTYYDAPLFNSLDTRSGITIRRNGKGRNDFYQSNIR
ncbi:MAG: carboxypeptidase-like regulatory domain-containing protein [Chitinophagales bacterium]